MVNWFKKFVSREYREERARQREGIIEELERNVNPPKNVWDIKVLDEYTIQGITFMLGDKVLTKSNECDPYMVGEIVEFWNNDGKWTNCIPYVKDSNGDIWGVMGIIKPYSEELENEIKDLRPLEQWNYFVDDVYKFSEEEMVIKESKYEQLKKNKEKLKAN